jgi:hypothetical protein
LGRTGAGEADTHLLEVKEGEGDEDRVPFPASRARGGERTESVEDGLARILG